MRFCDRIEPKVSFKPEDRLRLLGGTLGTNSLKTELLEFFAKYPSGRATVLDDQEVRNSVLEILTVGVSGDTSLIDSLWINELLATSTDNPQQTWSRLAGVKKLLGSAGTSLLPIVYRSMAPRLLSAWLFKFDETPFREFAAECGKELLPIGRSLIHELADEFLVKTPAEWPILKRHAEFLSLALTHLQLSNCYEAGWVKRIVSEPVLPAETARLLLASLFCSPAHLARNIMEDVAWQSASVHRLKDKATAATLTSLALDARE